MIDNKGIEFTSNEEKDLISFFWSLHYSNADDFEKGRDDRELAREGFRNTPTKCRHDRSALHTIIDFTRITISCVFISSGMNTASIDQIEISTFLSSSFHELPRDLIEYIIHSATQTIATLTHRVSTRHKEKARNIEPSTDIGAGKPLRNKAERIYGS